MFKYIADIIKGIISLAEGLAVTFKYLFVKPYTMQYPDEKPDLPTRFRGRLVMPIDPDKNDNRCTACNICVKACPNRSLEVEKIVDETGKPKPKAAKFMYNMATCMFCNLCVESCPFFAIVMSDEYELATPDKSGLMLELVSEKYGLQGKKANWWKTKFKEETE